MTVAVARGGRIEGIPKSTQARVSYDCDHMVVRRVRVPAQVRTPADLAEFRAGHSRRGLCPECDSAMVLADIYRTYEQMEAVVGRIIPLVEGSAAQRAFAESLRCRLMESLLQPADILAQERVSPQIELLAALAGIPDPSLPQSPDGVALPTLTAQLLLRHALDAGLFDRSDAGYWIALAKANPSEVRSHVDVSPLTKQLVEIAALCHWSQNPAAGVDGDAVRLLVYLLSARRTNMLGDLVRTLNESNDQGSPHDRWVNLREALFREAFLDALAGTPGHTPPF
jgi:hypothetical protein